ncbi:hypothetical protein Dsin_017837 [Dipteronia sinensis]|uniref:Uncharacterized protein n=1 Tax=Dipteronia sinensis TaxID=43782 RepID=A0AAE0AFS0_9ROSI|nr:hypothetical protein Dsin_017837 [Dipteronia sinensis]
MYSIAKASDPTRFLNLDGKVVDIMEERKPLKGPTEIAGEPKEQEEMAKEIQLKKQEERNQKRRVISD